MEKPTKAELQERVLPTWDSPKYRWPKYCCRAKHFGKKDFTVVNLLFLCEVLNRVQDATFV